MTIESIFSGIWTLVNGILSLEIPVGEYKITFWNILIYAFLVYIALKILFGLGTRGGDE